MPKIKKQDSTSDILGVHAGQARNPNEGLQHQKINAPFNLRAEGNLFCRNLQDTNGAVFVQLHKIGVECRLHGPRDQGFTLPR